MKQSEAWTKQIASDLEAADVLFRPSDPGSYCQAIAKYQQVVEKSVNAMVSVLNETKTGPPIVEIGTKHYPEKQINVLMRLPKSENQDLLSHILTIFSTYRRGEIRALCLLAPSLPPRRNTEYPYPTVDGEWTAPAAEDSFRIEEVYRFRSLTNNLVPMVGRFMQAAQYRPNDK